MGDSLDLGRVVAQPLCSLEEPLDRFLGRVRLASHEPKVGPVRDPDHAGFVVGVHLEEQVGEAHGGPETQNLGHEAKARVKVVGRSHSLREDSRPRRRVRLHGKLHVDAPPLLVPRVLLHAVHHSLLKRRPNARRHEPPTHEAPHLHRPFHRNKWFLPRRRLGSRLRLLLQRASRGAGRGSSPLFEARHHGANLFRGVFGEPPFAEEGTCDVFDSRQTVQIESTLLQGTRFGNAEPGDAVGPLPGRPERLEVALALAVGRLDTGGKGPALKSNQVQPSPTKSNQVQVGGGANRGKRKKKKSLHDRGGGAFGCQISA
mmetsp:Transcript_51251/g.116511  ORF Transcript_51251/g.116511 Transcript_51251/m.116511 type:complete len:316 (-) Transcript_51251:58-1005(-)